LAFVPLQSFSMESLREKTINTRAGEKGRGTLSFGFGFFVVVEYIIPSEISTQSIEGGHQRLLAAQEETSMLEAHYIPHLGIPPL